MAELLKRHRVAFDERYLWEKCPALGRLIGRFSRGRLPRAEALGCSVFALWAMQNVQTPVLREAEL
jgi:hypothetical protein